MKNPRTVETRRFPDDGATPNHPVLPLILVRGTEAAGADDPAAWFERRFLSNGWQGTWRWTVYPYHHFHTTHHEVLGVASGHARLRLGGENGMDAKVHAGDVIVIPAGVGHMRLEASEDFEVVGAYSEAGEPDLVQSGTGDLEGARHRIMAVPLPDLDPLDGRDGALCDYWK